MEHLSYKIWDEWTAFPIIPPVEDEIAGILDGSNCRKTGSEYEFTSGRIFALRRLLKLWADSEYQNIETIRIIYGEQQKASGTKRKRGETPEYTEISRFQRRDKEKKPDA